MKSDLSKQNLLKNSFSNFYYLCKNISMLFLKKYSSLLIVLFLWSCQNGMDEQDSSNESTVTKTSPLTTYLQRVAMVPTVQDNVIDGSTYCTIKFPYTVTVNNQSIAVNSAADYQKVFDNINASNTDDDIVHINFPVTMVYYNYIQKLIPNQSEFNELIDYWNLYPDLLAKINGLNINYPITINSYNSANQIASSASIVSDQAFFNYIKNLNEGQYISLQYPISIVDYNNQTKLINNNIDFENAIKYAIDYCPENNIATFNFAETIIKDSWQVDYFFESSEKTSYYNGYSFIFKSDKSVVASKGGTSVTGQWDITVQGSVQKLKLYFTSEALKGLNNDAWTLFEYNNSQIRLRCVSGKTNYLYFTKN